MAETLKNNIRILIADNNASIREGLANLLNGKEGLTVIAEASDGLEAISLAKDLEPDVVLMDISMPKMSGLEATALIKKDRPHIKIIAFSMYGENTLEEVLAAGASASISKGSGSKALIEKIKHVYLY